MKASGIKEKFGRLFAVVLAVTVMLCFSVSLSADLGPKPSIHITFLNMPEGECYGTLLSKTDTTGPASVWDGNDEYAHHNENENYSWGAFDYATWKKFVEYDDPDGFYFLQEGWDVIESDGIHWTYYPPQEFKILLYFPETDEFVTSMIYERYAFDSYFTVDMSTVGSIMPEGAVILDHVNPDTGDHGESADKLLLADRSYDYTAELVSLIVRILLTIAIELIVGLIFGFSGTKQFWVLFIINGITQVILNVLLFFSDYMMGYMAFVVFYILLELLVFAIEAVVYSILMKRYSDKPKKSWYYILYAFAANGVSFLTGMALAKWLPGIF